MIKMIVARSKNGYIGKDNKIPWSCPGDMKLFKTLTSNNIVVMGRKTYESLGRLLPNRKNFVLSTSRTGEEYIKNINPVIEYQKENPTQVIYIIGGAKIYNQFVDSCDEIILSEINEEVDGDTKFDNNLLYDFYLYDSKNMDGFSYNRYKRLKEP